MFMLFCFMSRFEACSQQAKKTAFKIDVKGDSEKAEFHQIRHDKITLHFISQNFTLTRRKDVVYIDRFLVLAHPKTGQNNSLPFSDLLL